MKEGCSSSWRCLSILTPIECRSGARTFTLSVESHPAHVPHPVCRTCAIGRKPQRRRQKGLNGTASVLSMPAWHGTRRADSTSRDARVWCANVCLFWGYARHAPVCGEGTKGSRGGLRSSRMVARIETPLLAAQRRACR
jgi:hypothetical protein